MRKVLIPLASLATLTLAACANKPPQATEGNAISSVTQQPPAIVAPNPATADVKGPKGVKGTLVFTNEGKTVHVVGEFSGLKPNAEHGIHVHENGSCEGKDFKSAGDHYNPWKTEHGGEDTHMRHAGDLGNLKSDKTGKAKIDVQIPSGPDVGVFGGKSVIVHEGHDDEHSQPSGKSGARIACGLIVEKM